MASGVFRASQFQRKAEFRSNIAMLLLLTKGKKYMDFCYQLRTESDHYFGDMIVKKFTETPEGDSAECLPHCYIHTSHKQGTSVAITAEQLLSSQEDFDLLKGYSSFHKIKARGEPIQELMIFTNMSFDEVNLLRNNISLVPYYLNEDILDIEMAGFTQKLACCKLQLLDRDSVGRPIDVPRPIPTEGLLSLMFGAALSLASAELNGSPPMAIPIWSDVKPLADVLHTCVVKRMPLDTSNACLKRYHVSLFLEHVLVKDERTDEATFHPDFVNGSNYSRGVADLRQQIINTWTDIGDWKTLTFSSSPNFGEKSSDEECYSLPIFAVEDDICEFFEKLVFVTIPDDIPLEEIVHEKVKKLLDLEATDFDSASIANRISDWIARELSDDKWLSFKTVKKMWRLIAQSNTFSVDYQSDVLDIHEPKIRPPTNLDRELESFIFSPTDRDVLHINSIFPESTAARVFFQLESMGIRNYVALSSNRLRKYGDEMAAIVESTILDLVVVVCKHDTFIQVYRKLAPISSATGQKTRQIIISDKTVEECERERQDNPGGNAPRPPSASQQVPGVANCLETEGEPLPLSMYRPNCVQMNVQQERIRLDRVVQVMLDRLGAGRRAERIDIALLQQVNENDICHLHALLDAQYKIILNRIIEYDSELSECGFAVILVHLSFLSQRILPEHLTFGAKLIAGVQLLSHPEPTLVFSVNRQPDDRDMDDFLDSFSHRVFNTFQTVVGISPVADSSDRSEQRFIRREFYCPNNEIEALTLHGAGITIEDWQNVEEDYISYIIFRFRVNLYHTTRDVPPFWC